VSWFVPRLTPSFLPILSCVYGYDDLAYPMLSLWSDRPCTLKVRLDLDGTSPAHGHGSNHQPVQSGLNGSSPPDALSKFRKRKTSRGSDMLPPITPQPVSTPRKFDAPEVHDGCPSTWFGIPLGYAFTRMAKAVTSSMVLLGPFAALVPDAPANSEPALNFSDVDVVPNEQQQATVSSMVGMLTADAKRYCRVVPVSVLSHFAAGVAAVVLAPTFMFAQAV
jgi:hypothetical protein